MSYVDYNLYPEANIDMSPQLHGMSVRVKWMNNIQAMETIFE